ncbi:E3 ubiquitin-protein ligase SINA-like 10 [Cucumis melo var. makuwa]|uniref:E3 ubiquitin-protein ligase SINA-like 10 n=1 Tax=Cucumis melo var. makuwa TaxID=1194695 RepID=A0A5D3BQW2_CUCMM|nr:E3 ubiquitin-protein ligase SINA-like 10 [Cucumis melo var. makuwa]TYK01470.1 E3 ubiquitin-protein ligase SINA-like 10 [Cucumis melo var. makuwa]
MADSQSSDGGSERRSSVISRRDCAFPSEVIDCYGNFGCENGILLALAAAPKFRINALAASWQLATYVAGQSRRYEPCSCPLDNCTFVGLAEQLYLHFSRRHKNSAKHFSYNTRFTICLNNGDTYRILKAEDDGVLFFLSYTFEIFGNAITVNWIGPLSSEKKFSYKINENTG